MKFDPEIYRRKSVRLRGYDYSQPGAYFVMICTKSKEYLFGDVVEGGMRLNEVGQMVQMIWDELPKYYQGVAVDAFQIMPNHIHGIIFIADYCRGEVSSPLLKTETNIQKRGGETPPLHHKYTLGQIVAYFKYQTTKDINKTHCASGIPLWQRNYYEHIICNGVELNRIRVYIKNNPLWHLDRENPQRTGNDSFEVEIFGNRKNRLVNEMS